MTFHKFALFPLVPQLMPGTTYHDINNDMVNNNIDYQAFESVVKIGGIKESVQEFESFYEAKEGQLNTYKAMSLDEDGQPMSIQEFDFSMVGIQVEVAPKVKDSVTQGTQLNSLLPLNIYSQGQIREEFQGTDLEAVIDSYHEANYTIVQRDLTNLIQKLGLKRDKDGNISKIKDISKLRDSILGELEKRDMPRHTKNGIKKLLNSDIKYINQLYEKNKIESVLYSIVTNSVIRQKMKGDLMVLQAVTGLEITARAIKQNDFSKAKELGVDLSNVGQMLKFYRKDAPANSTPEQLAASNTLAMQVVLPHRFKELGLGNLININDPRIAPELKELIGFRIPTEGHNSVDFIEVAGYLPPSAGSAIIVPSEVVGKSGSDYDIDKLTLYFPHYTYDHINDLVQKVPYLDESNSTIEQRLEILKGEEPNTYYNLLDKVMEKYNLSDEVLKKIQQVKADNAEIAAHIEKLNDSWESANEAERLLIRDQHVIFKRLFNTNFSEIENEIVYPKLITEFRSLTIANQNTKSALQNSILDKIKHVLSHPLMFDQLISPVGAYELEDIAGEIATQRGTKKADGFSEMLSFRNLVQQSHRMWARIRRYWYSCI